MPNLSVSELMTPDPAFCTPQSSIIEAAQAMQDCDCGAIPVVDNEQNRRVIGIITDRDIVIRLIAQDRNPAESTVRQAMSNNVVTLGEDATVDQCVRLMAQHQIRRVPIVDGNGRLVGIVAQADLARACTEEPELEEELAEMVEEVSEPSGIHGI